MAHNTLSKASLTATSAEQAKERAVPTAETKANRLQKWHALAATYLGECFDAMDATIYFIALVPAMSELLKTKDATTIGLYGSIVLAVFMVGWAIGSVLFGMVSDRFGRVKTMMWTILLYAGAGLATGPVIAYFGGNYGTAAACVELVYIVGIIAAFWAEDFSTCFETRKATAGILTHAIPIAVPVSIRE